MKNLYDLTDYPAFAEPGKPYRCIDPGSEQQHEQLAEYLDAETHRATYLEELKAKERPPNSVTRYAKAVPIGETLEGDKVLLVFQGAVLNNEYSGGWFAVVCDPQGFEVLRADLDEEERQVVQQMKHIAKGGADE